MGRAEQRQKDSTMAAHLKAAKVQRKGSTDTLPAMESRIKKAVPAGGKTIKNKKP